GQDLQELIVHGGQADVRGAEVEVEELTAGNNGENTTVLATTIFADGSAATLQGPRDSTVEVTETQEAATGVNEIQQITLPDSVNGGDFTLQFDTYPATDPIFAGASANDVELALLRTGLPQQDFAVTGSYGGPWRIEFTGALELTDVPTIVADGAGLWSGLDDWDLVRTQPGVEPANYAQLIDVPDEADGGTYKVSVKAGSQTRSVDVAYNATAVELEDALESLGTVGTGNVDVTREADGRLRVEFIEDLSGGSGVVMTIDPSALQGLAVSETQTGGGGDNEIQQVELAAAAAGGQFRLTFGGESTPALSTAADAAAVQAALEGLSTIGAGNVSVTVPVAGTWDVEFIGTMADTQRKLDRGFGGVHVPLMSWSMHVQSWRRELPYGQFAL
ncbi:hypothetical protein LCGC14_2884290, partial [marine sediment metagenome]